MSTVDLGKDDAPTQAVKPPLGRAKSSPASEQSFDERPDLSRSDSTASTYDGYGVGVLPYSPEKMEALSPVAIDSIREEIREVVAKQRSLNVAVNSVHRKVTALDQRSSKLENQLILIDQNRATIR